MGRTVPDVLRAPEKVRQAPVGPQDARLARVAVRLGQRVAHIYTALPMRQRSQYRAYLVGAAKQGGGCGRCHGWAAESGPGGAGAEGTSSAAAPVSRRCSQASSSATAAYSCGVMCASTSSCLSKLTNSRDSWTYSAWSRAVRTMASATRPYPFATTRGAASCSP